jgi:hypothetical protein
MEDKKKYIQERLKNNHFIKHMGILLHDLQQGEATLRLTIEKHHLQQNGFTHGGVNVYYDPIVKINNTVPNYSEIPQEIRTISTIFDGNGTLFYDYRDSYIVPGQGNKFLKFPRQNVFL